MRRPDDVLTRDQLLMYCWKGTQAIERRRRIHPLPPAEDRPAVRHHLDRDRARDGVSVSRGRRVGHGLTNLPIRIRLTLVFACSMAIVLLATGAFLFVRVGNSLDHNVQEALETRSAELGTDLREGISISTSVLPDDQDESSRRSSAPTAASSMRPAGCATGRC